MRRRKRRKKRKVNWRTREDIHIEICSLHPANHHHFHFCVAPYGGEISCFTASALEIKAELLAALFATYASRLFAPAARRLEQVVRNIVFIEKERFRFCDSFFDAVRLQPAPFIEHAPVGDLHHAAAEAPEAAELRWFHEARLDPDFHSDRSRFTAALAFRKPAKSR
jgi:hypothetical protein